MTDLRALAVVLECPCDLAPSAPEDFPYTLSPDCPKSWVIYPVVRTLGVDLECPKRGVNCFFLVVLRHAQHLL